MSRRVHSYLRYHTFFIDLSRFSDWAVFLSKDVGYYLKPTNDLLILSFLSPQSLRQKNIGLEMNLYEQECRCQIVTDTYKNNVLKFVWKPFKPPLSLRKWKCFGEASLFNLHHLYFNCHLLA